jgi:hypothetical protein
MGGCHLTAFFLNFFALLDSSRLIKAYFVSGYVTFCRPSLVAELHLLLVAEFRWRLTERECTLGMRQKNGWFAVAVLLGLAAAQ